MPSSTLTKFTWPDWAIRTAENGKTVDALRIRPFDPADEPAAIALWHGCGLLRPWNDPHKDIARKLRVQPGLFLVATRPAEGAGEELLGTAMAGYDGHRGSVYYLAVAPGVQGLSVGRRLMAEVEQRLLALGCAKINVLVRSNNSRVLGFYAQLGYARDEVFSLGKRLIPDL
ncbi:GNAT family acetyltransferase [Verminephrobacter aporrectodeae subsp. tuberculatae]|nr:GNAT family acetyltransferase [Verminephrobacter aporrectodeae subsp. tuberculatae]MCW5289062.1 GNAT family acetyltransferase [Verminephrobacter aporrectodeae subsp. tuberculatae]MCW8206646.1 GNAT family acetyltransferase [Verminephrobacter aporrectodeae subsp. tuberculatae]